MDSLFSFFLSFFIHGIIIQKFMEGKREFILVGFVVFTEFMDGDRAGQLEESGQRLSSIIHDITEVLCTSENEK